MYFYLLPLLNEVLADDFSDLVLNSIEDANDLETHVSKDNGEHNVIDSIGLKGSGFQEHREAAAREIRCPQLIH